MNKLRPLLTTLALIALLAGAGSIAYRKVANEKQEATRKAAAARHAARLELASEAVAGDQHTLDKLAASRKLADEASARKVAEDKVVADKLAKETVPERMVVVVDPGYSFHAGDQIAGMVGNNGFQSADGHIHSEMRPDPEATANLAVRRKQAASKLATDEKAAAKLAASEATAMKLAEDKLTADKLAQESLVAAGQ